MKASRSPASGLRYSAAACLLTTAAPVNARKLRRLGWVNLIEANRSDPGPYNKAARYPIGLLVDGVALRYEGYPRQQAGLIYAAQVRVILRELPALERLAPH